MSLPSQKPQSPFGSFGLDPKILKSLDDVGYEKPSPIQEQAIPYLMQGEDLVGQAQTGTGKTAAFALPLLSRLDLKQKEPCVLVLTPTRELAIQVAEAFQRYANHLKNLHVVPIYGGADINTQLKQLKRGAHVIVGTPGRVMDHMRRKTLAFHKLQALVLDEADEMLRMGFADDVEWILKQTPDSRQTALFSATMPKPIRRIASVYLKHPKEVTIKVKTATADTINQRYYIALGMKKLDVLTKILETEAFEGVLIFVRTRQSTKLLAEKLAARGYACDALNGDVAQKSRERTVERLKQGKIDIVVATDVAARGLDVERISHVVNFDIPHDIESYVHRIGRTGRAGRSGEAILFIAPREKHLLAAIEKATKQKMQLMQTPTHKDVARRRRERFRDLIQGIAAQGDLKEQHNLLKSYKKDYGWEIADTAAALLKLVQMQNPTFVEETAEDFFEQPPKKPSKKRHKKPPQKKTPTKKGATKRERPHKKKRKFSKKH